MAEFLPISKAELTARGIDRPDFIVVSGDAYVDHPTFGAAIISRVVEAEGFSVGMIAQPGYRSPNDMMRLGRPNYAFLVSAGNVDSMVAHYTAAKKRRSDDAYSPGNKAGRRPDRALLVYCRLLREAYPEAPIIIGGLEASFRRFAHYDYWDDAVRPSILAESGADLLVYGMGEAQTLAICRRLAAGEPVETLRDIRGTCYLCDPRDTPWGGVQCPDFAVAARDKRAYAKAARRQMEEQDEVRGRTLLQRHGDRMLVQNPPMPALETAELDRIAELPYVRTWHPCYDAQGGIPAAAEVEFSITHNRGCFGACSFCAIAFHQGRRVTCRSGESVLREAEGFVRNPRFRGYISDVGGPTANFRAPSCEKQKTQGLCRDRRCLAPAPCPALEAGHAEYLALLQKLRALPGVKKVFIRSGIRYDYVLADPDERFFDELVEHHVSGQLRVAPEHCVPAVLRRMGKPSMETYLEFSRKFYAKSKALGKDQYLVPYLMSSHPGCTLRDAVELACFLKEENIRPDQVQDFYPTPGTISTCMYYTGLDPLTMEEVYVPKSAEERAMQRALLQFWMPQNRALCEKALRLVKRTDRIGTGPNCLIPPAPGGERTGRPDKPGSGKAAPPARKNGARTPGTAGAPPKRKGGAAWRGGAGGAKKGS